MYSGASVGTEPGLRDEGLSCQPPQARDRGPFIQFFNIIFLPLSSLRPANTPPGSEQVTTTSLRFPTPHWLVAAYGYEIITKPIAGVLFRDHGYALRVYRHGGIERDDLPAEGAGRKLVGMDRNPSNTHVVSS